MRFSNSVSLSHLTIQGQCLSCTSNLKYTIPWSTTNLASSSLRKTLVIGSLAKIGWSKFYSLSRKYSTWRSITVWKKAKENLHSTWKPTDFTRVILNILLISVSSVCKNLLMISFHTKRLNCNLANPTLTSTRLRRNLRHLLMKEMTWLQKKSWRIISSTICQTSWSKKMIQML